MPNHGKFTQRERLQLSHVSKTSQFESQENSVRRTRGRVFLGGDTEELDFLRDEGTEKSENSFILVTELLLISIKASLLVEW